jgi:hypothetical protein
MSTDRETLESGIFNELLGLGPEFFIDLEENWKEEEISINNAILENLRKNFEQVDFEESQTTFLVLAAIGFESETASWLSKILGSEIEDPNIIWEKIQDFIQMRLDALVDSFPDWSKASMEFTVLTDDQIKKTFTSKILSSQEVLHGDEDALRLSVKDPSADKLTQTGIWYHATNYEEACEILKNGFDFRTAMKNKNFSHGDGFYFTDSPKDVIELFLHNSIKEFGTPFSIEKRPNGKQQHKIYVLAFNSNDLLEDYKNQSIDLTILGSEERLRRIVHFFSQKRLPTKKPTIEKHGLAENYTTDVEYIRGPHSTFIPTHKKNIDNIYTNSGLIQLCVRCVGTERMLRDLKENIQTEVLVIDVEEEEIAEMSKLFLSFIVVSNHDNVLKVSNCIYN